MVAGGRRWSPVVACGRQWSLVVVSGRRWSPVVVGGRHGDHAVSIKYEAYSEKIPVSFANNCVAVSAGAG